MKISIFLLIFFVSHDCFSQKFDSTWRKLSSSYIIKVNIDPKLNTIKNGAVVILRDGHILISDSITSGRPEVLSRDINGDGHNDILVFQSHGARPNLTYYLYLFRPGKNEFIRVKGFDDLCNVAATPIKGIVYSTTLTSVNEFCFYRIDDAGKLIDLHICEVDRDFSKKGYARGLKRVRSQR